MKQRNESIPNQAAMATPVIIGAAIAFILIAIFLFNAGRPDPSWPKLWMLQPLIVVPLAGAVGGVCYHFINSNLRAPKVIAILLSIVIYIFGLWIGTVLGLNGTYWN